MEKQTIWQKWMQWLRAVNAKHQGRHYLFIALGFVIASGAGLLFYINRPLPDIKQRYSVTPQPKAVVFYSPLTGLPVADEAATKQAATAIMIENSPDARPQSGLKEAGVVFEAIAEGGITRFLALYQQEKPQLVGPVRSLRPYYVSWLTPFNASVAHVGGSFKALQQIRSGSYRDIDQFFNGGSYWRATDRYAPHNVYTNFERLDALNASKNYTQSLFTGFARQAVPKKNQPTPAGSGVAATTITVDISSAAYNPSYAYDATSKTYLRSHSNSPHMDREKGQIAPRVAVVIKVPMTLGFEDGYREQITTTGQGDAYVFQDGMVTEGTWHKKDDQTQLQFTTKDGKELPLARGQTWITAIPNHKGLTWK